MGELRNTSIISDHLISSFKLGVLLNKSAQAQHIDRKTCEQSWSLWQLDEAPSTPYRPDLEKGNKRPILKNDMHCEWRQASNLEKGWYGKRVSQRG